jgi:hypothetical protein
LTSRRSALASGLLAYGSLTPTLDVLRGESKKTIASVMAMPKPIPRYSSKCSGCRAAPRIVTIATSAALTIARPTRSVGARHGGACETAAKQTGRDERASC